MSRPLSILSVVMVAVAALVAGDGSFDATGAAEFHFVSESLGDGRAIWVPKDVVIHKRTEIQDGLAFVLENPTDRTHAFAAHGLFEEITGAQGETTRKPLRVNVTPDDSVRVQVSTAQFEGIEESVNEDFEFFCPLHKGKAHLGGTIHVVP
ncbi:MAG: hypothetical protein HY581_05795 [Nitrospirae bacterium]|nr:hypothetical protein [Nitrospirota bacterium]